jgi:Ser/Thr protein kinase RdoA (MazF antagonist)
VGVEDREALAVAVAVAGRHGLRVTDPVILRDQLNVLVHLRPAPVVARVAGTIRRARPGTAWQERELAVAAHLAREGAPVVAPSGELPPGPHVFGGRVVSFWDCADGETDPVSAGRALRECHQALRTFKGSLPVLGGLTEAEALNARLAAEQWIAPETAHDWQQRFETLMPLIRALRSPVGPLHGDAHLGNVLGGRWNDWEDTSLGPVGWDAACLIAGSRDPADQQAAFDAAGLRLDPGELSLWVEARRLQIEVWRQFVAGTSSPDGTDDVRSTSR